MAADWLAFNVTGSMFKECVHACVGVGKEGMRACVHAPCACTHVHGWTV